MAAMCTTHQKKKREKHTLRTKALAVGTAEQAAATNTSIPVKGNSFK